MKKWMKRVLCFVLTVCLALAGAAICFAEEVPENPGIQSCLVLSDGSAENALCYFTIGGDVCAGDENAAFCVEEKVEESQAAQVLYSGTMADFDTREMTDAETGETKTLYLLCLPESALYGILYFGAGAFTRPDGTPYGDLRVHYDDISYWYTGIDSSLNGAFRVLNPEDDCVQSDCVGFGFRGMDSLPQDLFRLEKTDGSGNTVTVSERVEEGHSALRTVAEAGTTVYTLRYGDKAVYTDTVNALSEEEFQTLLRKDRVLSVLKGLGTVPCLPIYIVKELLIACIGGPILCMIPPMLACLPFLGLLGVWEGIDEWAHTIRYYWGIDN
ncbi:MAG: hypothetical protein ACI4I5_07785 [Acutalibacteraceae bacterium]